MGWLHDIILRKFNSIAGTRYEEIIKAYENFFLTEEEMVIPEIESLLLAFDRFSCELPENVYEVLLSFRDARVTAVYVIDEAVFRIIRETLGEAEAEEFKKKELAFAEKFLETVEEKLRTLNINWERRIIFGDKSEYVMDALENHDLLILSRHYGFETTKTHSISPVVFRIVQNVKKPVIVY